MKTYDVAVLGGGPGGDAAALQVVRRGGTACLVEQGHLGGVCLNVGCMPTKAMLAASEACWRMQHTADFGVSPGRPTVDGRALMRRVTACVTKLRGRTENGMSSKKGLDIVRGRGRLTGPTTLSVQTSAGEQEIRAKAIVVATGAEAVRPDFLPWDSGQLWTTEQAVTAEDLPPSLIIMGGGVIGCEFATAYAELGVRVVLVEMLDRLLAAMDEEASQAAEALLAKRGVEVVTGHKVERMTVRAGRVRTDLDDGRTFQAERALIVVGRKANVADIGLEAAGVHVADGIVPVDDRCRTNVENVYAVGDVAEHRQYAHLAERMGIVAGDNVMGYQTRDDRTVVPAGVYSHPEIASVGLTHAEAEQRYGKVGVYRYRYDASGTGLVYDETDGQLKVLADPRSGKVLGALWIGPRAIDNIHEFALAMHHGLTLEQIAETIHAHPTFQEAAAVAAESFIRRKRRGGG